MCRYLPFVMLAGVLLCGCSKGQQQASRPSSSQSSGTAEELKTVADEAQAVRRFQRLWHDELTPQLSDQQQRYVGPLDQRIKSNKDISARRQTLEECYRRVDGTLTENERKFLILYGELADLSGTEDCWAVESHGGFGNELCGYMDTHGELIFVWIVPEG